MNLFEYNIDVIEERGEKMSRANIGYNGGRNREQIAEGELNSLPL